MYSSHVSTSLSVVTCLCCAHVKFYVGLDKRKSGFRTYSVVGGYITLFKVRMLRLLNTAEPTGNCM